MKISPVFPFLYPYALEQQGLSFLHTHGCLLMTWDNLRLPNFEVASLVQVSQQPESEFHVLCEMTS